jgi:hypothetical protein
MTPGRWQTLLVAFRRAGLRLVPSDAVAEPDSAQLVPQVSNLMQRDSYPRRPLAATRRTRRRDWALFCHRNSWIPVDFRED